MTFFTLLFKLLIGHAVADFALQSDVMAKGKNRHNRIDKIPPGQKYVPCWPYWMSAHALIHAGAVWIITQNTYFALAEFVGHFLIDYAKCESLTDHHIDQGLHFVCKLSYVWGF